MKPLCLISLLLTLVSCMGEKTEIKQGNATQVQEWGWRTFQTSTLDLSGKLETFAGYDSFGVQDGFGTYALFYNPAGIVTDEFHLYIADGHSIRRVSKANAEVVTFAGVPDEAGHLDGIGDEARFNLLWGITTDGSYLYTTDNQHTIRRISKITGEVTTIAGSVGVSGSSNGSGNVAKFNQPQGITTDGVNLYVADSLNHQIRQIEIATNTVSTVAGSAVSGYANGTGTAARFNTPTGIITDGYSLFVTDLDNKVIRKISLASKAVTTLAGDPGQSGSADGIGRAARFNQIVAMTADASYLYLVEISDCTIRRVSKNNAAVSTISGTAGNCQYVDGPLGTNKLFAPIGITNDRESIFIMESSMLRKLN